MRFVPLILSIILILVVLIIFIVISFIIASKLHNGLFKARYKDDSRINYFTKEEFNLLSEDIEVPMDNITLRGGLFYYPNYDTKKLIILNHGMWSSISAYMQDIAYFAKNGYQVLAINHEGVESSDGKNIRGLANSLRCLDNVIKYVKKTDRFKDLDLYVVGHSWGGFAAANIALYHKDLKGVLAISPFISVKDCLKGFFPKSIWFTIPFFLLLEKIYCKKYSKANAYKALKDFKGNIVIIHSENDNIVKFMYNTNVLMKKKINASFLIYDNRDHCPHYTMDSILLTRKFNEEVKKIDPKEVDDYMRNTDFHKLGYIDEEVLDKAVSLLTGCEVSNGRE